MQELEELPLNEGRLLDIGCDSGYETIAMMWFLGRADVLGIDKRMSSIEQFALQLQSDILESKEALEYQQVGGDDRRWWISNVPTFLKDGKFPHFSKVDVSNRERLVDAAPESSCAFAYCSNVLNHIHEDQGHSYVSAAMSSISKVLKFGAWFVAQEPNDPELDYFQDAFVNNGYKVRVSSKRYKVEYRCQRIA